MLPECWRQCDQKLPVSVRCQNVSRVQPQAPTVPDDDTLQHFEAYVFVNSRSSDMLNPNSTFTVHWRSGSRQHVGCLAYRARGFHYTVFCCCHRLFVHNLEFFCRYLTLSSKAGNFEIFPGRNEPIQVMGHIERVTFVKMRRDENNVGVSSRLLQIATAGSIHTPKGVKPARTYRRSHLRREYRSQTIVFTFVKFTQHSTTTT